ncbi:MAG: threonine/serine exporter family protein [Muribaculaceae bacterium]|nr:threonine/serine exporter family protein [Muribaculaceae bacterium]
MKTLSENYPTTSALGAFLAEYAARLLGCGATCMRLEMNLGRMAAAYGHKVEVTIFPRHLHLTVTQASEHHCSEHSFTTIAAVPKCGISYACNTRLSELSWTIADHGMPLSTAWERFEEIVASPGISANVVLVLAALANASFCRLFGGDWVAMACVTLSTLVGFYFKQHLARHKIDVRLIFFLCAFISTVIASSDMLFGLGSTPRIAIGSSVLYLVPGIPFLNSFSDLLNHHYICAFSRFMDAVVLTCCLSLGLCAGMALMQTGMF